MRRKLLIFRDASIPYTGQRIWRAAINSDVDGDTLWVERDTGCDQSQLVEIRLTASEGLRIDGTVRTIRGFNAFERFTAGGKLVTAEVKRVCSDWRVVRIETDPDTEKFGRWTSPILIFVADLPLMPPDIPGSCFVYRADSPDKDANQRTYLDLAEYLAWRFPEYTEWKEY